MPPNKFLTMILLLAAAGIVAYGASSLPEVEIKDADLSLIPYTIGAWKGENTNDDTIPDLTKRIYATNILYRIYAKEGDPPITVFVSTCKSLKKHPNFKYHFPMYCYVGSGWKIVQATDIPVFAGTDRAFFARQLILQRGEHRMVIVFYLQTRRSVKVTPGIQQRIQDLLNRCVFRRSDITVVRFSSPVAGDNVQVISESIGSFIKLFEPELSRRLAELG
jgi:EpsI family protein